MYFEQIYSAEYIFSFSSIGVFEEKNFTPLFHLIRGGSVKFTRMKERKRTLIDRRKVFCFFSSYISREVEKIKSENL